MKTKYRVVEGHNQSNHDTFYMANVVLEIDDNGFIDIHGFIETMDDKKRNEYAHNAQSRIRFDFGEFELYGTFRSVCALDVDGKAHTAGRHRFGSSTSLSTAFLGNELLPWGRKHQRRVE